MEPRREREGRPITRREFGRLAGAFGLTAALGAVAELAQAGQVATWDRSLAKAKEIQLAQQKGGGKETVIRMGVASALPDHDKAGFPFGYWVFAKDLHERTEGRLRVELIGGNKLCTEITCAQKFSTGTIQGFGSSTQNASLTYPFLSAFDYAFLFPSRASMQHFWYHPRVEKLFRKPLREKYDVEILTALLEGRAIYLGLKYKDKPRARRPQDIKGAKIRVTGSPLGRIALDLFGTNPIPLDWAETFEGLKSGLVDGMENFPSAAPAFRMTTALSQLIHVEFFAGFEHLSISHRFLTSLPDDLREAVMESGYHTHQWIQKELERLIREVNGIADPPPPGTTLHKDGLRVNILTKEEKREWVERASPEFNPKPWQEWREKLAKMAGGIDLYAEFHKVAQEVPENIPPEAIKPNRWWKA
jgi:TRAP-type C4-dicarboxylate transport system substrate-binding protein